ncbi:MAG: hypothetical protein V1897_05030 [Pseudomonadota bacterium]
MRKKSSVNEVGFSLCLAPLVRMAFTASILLIALADDCMCQVFSKQTREQCNECCNNSGYDEYYAEQCRLKCFRNHDHCIGAKGAAVEKQPSVKEEPQKPTKRETETREPQIQRPQPEPKPQVKKPEVVWPNPLNLTPGRESEAAAHILILNGIPPQHPNYAMALRSIQDILINFARNNPGGGALPTAQLERIISQMK